MRRLSFLAAILDGGFHFSKLLVLNRPPPAGFDRPLTPITKRSSPPFMNSSMVK